MSTIDMTQVAGLQAVNEEGQVIGTLSVDDLTELVATKIVQEAISARSASVMSEAYTIAATDEYEDQLELDTNPAYVRSLDSDGNPKRTATTSLATVVGGLINSNKLYPFQYKGNISISSYDSPTELDKITEMGIWGIVPTSGAWSTLLVFKSFGGSGGDIQLLFKYNGDVQSRIRTSNSDYTWSSFIKLNN